MSGHRRAAVALHGLSAHDRQWMLAALPDADQQILQQYLDELDALGFSYGPDLAGDLNADAGQYPAPDSANPATNLSSLQQLQAASVQQMLACLQEEPASLVARLLAHHDWVWREAVLAQMSALARQRVRSLLAEPLAEPMQAAPLLDEFLLDAVAARLREQAFAPPPGHRATANAGNVGNIDKSHEKRGWLASWGTRWNR